MGEGAHEVQHCPLLKTFAAEKTTNHVTHTEIVNLAQLLMEASHEANPDPTINNNKLAH